MSSSASAGVQPTLELLKPLAGRWEVDKHENLEEFLEANGMNWLKRKMAATFMASGIHMTISFSENKDSADSPVKVEMKLKTVMFERVRSHPLPCKEFAIESLHGGPDETKQVQLTAKLFSAKAEESAKEKDLEDILKDVGSDIILVQYWVTPEKGTTMRNRTYINKEGKLIQDYHKDEIKAWMKRTFVKETY